MVDVGVVVGAPEEWFMDVGVINGGKLVPGLTIEPALELIHLLVELVVKVVMVNLEEDMII
jgi:hypothetical protein